MAKKSETVSIIDSDDAETARSAEEMAALNAASGGDLFNTVDELRAGGAAGVVCIVTRYLPVDKKGFCCNISVAEFSLEKMRTMVGPGKYMVQIKGPKGFLPGGGIVDIAEMAETAVKSGGSGDFISFMESLEKRNAERSAKIWELAMVSVPTLLAGFFNRTPPQSDIPALIAALKPAPGPTITDLTSALANMQTLTNPKNSESQVDTILKVFGAAQDLMGGKDGDSNKEGSNWVDVIRDLIKVAPDAIKPMLEARMQAMQQAGPPNGQSVPSFAPAIPLPQNTNTPHVQHAEPVASVASGAVNIGDDEEMLKLFMPLIKANLSKVAGWAEKDRDPEVYADVLVDELPDNFGSFIPLNKIFEYLNHPQWFEEVVKIEPRLQSHKEWCDECRLAIIEIMKVFQSEAVQPAATDETASPTE